MQDLAGANTKQSADCYQCLSDWWAFWFWESFGWSGLDNLFSFGINKSLLSLRAFPTGVMSSSKASWSPGDQVAGLWSALDLEPIYQSKLFLSPAYLSSHGLFMLTLLNIDARKMNFVYWLKGPYFDLIGIPVWNTWDKRNVINLVPNKLSLLSKTAWPESITLYNAK